jgi:hypothetical protein
VLFLPLSLLSFRNAYFGFVALNLALLGYVWRRLKLPWELLAFAPLALTLGMGQDSILMFCCLALAWQAATKDRPWLSGLWLGVAMFRFQNILIVMLLLLIWREWRALKGWLLSAGLAVLLSAALASPVAYVGVLADLSHSSGRYLQWVERMVNLRGLIFATLPQHQAWLLPLLSVLIFLAAVWRGWVESLEYRLRIAMIVAALISFHLYAHELVLLIIPLACLVHESARGRIMASAIMLMALLPVFNSNIYLASLGTVLLFLAEVFCLPLASVADHKQARVRAARSWCQPAGAWPQPEDECAPSVRGVAADSPASRV